MKHSWKDLLARWLDASVPVDADPYRTLGGPPRARSASTASDRLEPATPRHRAPRATGQPAPAERPLWFPPPAA